MIARTLRVGVVSLLFACTGSPEPEPGPAPSPAAVPSAAPTEVEAPTRFGRADVAYPATTTPVVVDLTGVAAWQAGNSLQLVAPEVGLTLAGPENGFARYPDAGATAIRGELDWRAAFAPLVDAGRGDTTWVTQLVSAGAGIGRHQVVAHAGRARGFTVRDGAAATLSANLAPVALDRSLALRFRGPAFAALAADAGVGGQPAAAATIAIHTLPATAARGDFHAGRYTGLPSLVEFGPVPGTADLTQRISYGNPFAAAGAGWTDFATVVYGVPVPIRTPHGVGSLSAMMTAAVPIDALVAGELAPVISPVRGVTVNGAPLVAAAVGVGRSPVIAWDAPAIGAPTGYTVTVYAVDGSGSGVNLVRVTALRADAPSVRIPDGVLAAGRAHVLVITAIAAPGLAAVPRAALPYAAADHVTAQLTP